MNVNLLEKIRDINGDPIKKDQSDDLILRDLCIEACLAPVQGEVESPEQKEKNYLLFRRISGVKSIDLSAEEISFLKAKIGKLRPTLIMGQAWELLEGKKMKADDTI